MATKMSFFDFRLDQGIHKVPDHSTVAFFEGQTLNQCYSNCYLGVVGQKDKKMDKFDDNLECPQEAFHRY